MIFTATTFRRGHHFWVGSKIAGHFLVTAMKAMGMKAMDKIAGPKNPKSSKL